ncbi:Probable polyamine transporter [Seminavis robusta]|uniref:Probable polyamine transporter n=1 Tax=Seminavis robusta TaxID=568900 RepID=A0A9N8E1K5_9STRA|nr:Probable polyamine transporter [Seminavis robusta]|eukprot:Sro526_g160350.1 Probable polyamine transporter (509) ;mRNA; f:19456-21252
MSSPDEEKSAKDGFKDRNPFDGTAQAIPIPPEAHSLTVLPLTAIVYFSVSGGPFSTTQAVRSGGAFYALLGYMLAPVVIAWQENQITAELSVAYPHSSGSVVWCEAAFGPFIAWLNGVLSLVSGITGNAIFPGLFVNFILEQIPRSADEEQDLPVYIRFCVLAFMVLVMGYINWSGLNSIGNTTMLIGIIALTPFVIFVLVGMFQVDASNWLALPSLSVGGYMAESEYELGGGFFPYATLGGVLLRPFLNTLFFNHNCFDSTATFSEDCGRQPEKVIPRSLNIAWFAVFVFYLLPVAVATGVSSGNQLDWKNGYLSFLAGETVGPWLGNWLIFANGVSNIALYQAVMSGVVFKLMGMAHNGLLPRFLGVRSSRGTPTNAIIFSTFIIFFLSMVRLHKLVEMQNFNYGIALLLEYAAFIKLRISQPNVPRPYRVPFGTVGCSLMVIPSALFILTVLLLASYHAMIVGAVTFGFSVITYQCVAKRIYKKRDDTDSLEGQMAPMKDSSEMI